MQTLWKDCLKSHLKWWAVYLESWISMRFYFMIHHKTAWAMLPANLILDLFWQRDPHQSEGMAYAPQLLFPHGSDLCCVCRRHQSNQIPHHLSSSKCIPFSFIPLSKPCWKLIMNVYSGVGPGCSMWRFSKPASCVCHASAACMTWSLFYLCAGTMSPDDLSWINPLCPSSVCLCPLMLVSVGHFRIIFVNIFWKVVVYKTFSGH